MIHSRSLGSKALSLINALILLCLSLVCLYPMWHVICYSLSSADFVAKNRGLVLFPVGFQIKAYQLVFRNPNILSGFLNTMFYLTVGSAVNYVTTVLGAYTLSRKHLLLKKPIMIFLTVTMFFEGGLIPFFLLVRDLGLMNSRMAMIIPYAAGVYNIIIMRTSFQSIPDSLCESAYIDGANDFIVLTKIILPLSMAVSAVIILYNAVWYWNMWFPAMIFLTDRAKFPLQTVLREVLINNDVNRIITGAKGGMRVDGINVNNGKALVKYATIVVATLPVLISYPFAQKFFMQGVLIGSLKE